MTAKTLTVETTKGTKTYTLSPTSQGFEVYRVESGFFSMSVCGQNQPGICG